MKKMPSKTVTLLLAVILCIFAFSMPLQAGSDTSDPLVTLSYLNEIVLPQIKNDVLMEVSKNETLISNNADSSVGQEAGYTLLELTTGQRLYSHSTLELIVRPGSDVMVLSPFEEQGIADITGSKEYLDGDIVDINSYCIIPRGDDGRGIEVINEKSYILVRGEYYIG